MPRTVTYRITDRPDGRFDVAVTMEPARDAGAGSAGAQAKTFLREGVATLAEAEAWVEGLRVLMGALGAPVARAEDGGAAVAQGVLQRSNL
ncbi:hypothetical protein [Methylobacterium segetis]|uniref:hypothetical protein n=1 Tax=Methylobacterium segetis TaxID=2488750 RepID=UPI00104E9B8E|nr:hypothetical protein [Methylobacterium segetis]